MSYLGIRNEAIHHMRMRIHTLYTMYSIYIYIYKIENQFGLSLVQNFGRMKRGSNAKNALNRFKSIFLIISLAAQCSILSNNFVGLFLSVNAIRDKNISILKLYYFIYMRDSKIVFPLDHTKYRSIYILYMYNKTTLVL